MRLRWMPQARKDLAEIIAYIARDDPTAAERVYDRLVSAAALLLEQPGMGRPGRVDGTRELVVPRTPCALPYRVRVGSQGVVQILAVIHSSRQFPQSFD
jgi:plasmid stabilization system protein ParE